MPAFALAAHTHHRRVRVGGSHHVAASPPLRGSSGGSGGSHGGQEEPLQEPKDCEAALHKQPEGATAAAEAGSVRAAEAEAELLRAEVAHLRARLAQLEQLGATTATAGEGV